MPPIVIETELEPRDYRALTAHLGKLSASKHWLLRGYRPLVLIVAAVSLLVAVLLRLAGSDIDPTTGFWAVTVCLLSMLAFQRFTARRWQPDKNGALLSAVRFEIDSSGIHSLREGLTGFADWNRVQRVDETADHVFFPLDRVSAYMIPKRSLSPESMADVIEQMRRWHAERTRSALPLEVPNTGFPPSTSAAAAAARFTGAARTGFWRALRGNLVTGLRLFGLRRVSAKDFTGGFDQAIALLVVASLVALGFDWLRSEADAELGFYGFYGWAYYLLGGFWVCALIARYQSPIANTRALLVAWLAVLPYVLAALWLIHRLFSPRLAVDAGALLVFIFTLATVRATFGSVRLGTWLPIAAAVIGLPLFCDYLGLETSLWAVPETEASSDASDDDLGAAESILFDEPERVAAAVEALAPQRPGATDAYFVGFAAHGAQQVFRREALFGEKAFARKLGSAGRSVELINDVTDRDTYPLATVSGLRYALELIGQRMDRENDMLVLFVTSHGSRDDGIDVSNGGLPLAPLPPADLRNVLDDSGIKWRVVVVSACYAGAYLDSLRSDTTLVITASDAEHTSFGCTDDRDLTYFGEAFLRDAMPTAASLEAAFLKARALIDERENAEQLVHSNPQIFIGSAIRAKLAASGAPSATPAATMRTVAR